MFRLTVTPPAVLLSAALAACGPGAPTDSSEFAVSLAMTRTWDAISFNPAAAEFPEGIAIDPQGHLYVGLTQWAEIRRVESDGTVRPFAALLPHDQVPIPPGAPGLLGLASTARGDIYAALVTFNPATHGVHRIDGRTGTSERLPGSGAICWPNALVFDQRGNLYVTESTRVPCGGDPTVGAVWRIPPGGSAEPWAESIALAGTGQLPLPAPIGANGIVFRPGDGGPGTLIVANTEQGALVSIPIQPNGSPGEVATLAQDPMIFTVDGIVLDIHGAIYAMVIGQNRIVKVSRDGTTLEVVASGAPLDFPVNAVFGVRGPDRGRLFVANFALPDFGGTRPGIVIIEP